MGSAPAATYAILMAWGVAGPQALLLSALLARRADRVTATSQPVGLVPQGPQEALPVPPALRQAPQGPRARPGPPGLPVSPQAPRAPLGLPGLPAVPQAPQALLGLPESPQAPLGPPEFPQAPQGRRVRSAPPASPQVLSAPPGSPPEQQARCPGPRVWSQVLPEWFPAPRAPRAASRSA